MRSVRDLVLIACGVLVGGVAVFLWQPRPAPAQTLAAAKPPAAATAPAPSAGDQVQADIASLKDARPSQSHTMMDVGYHAANMWFAAQKKNWGLARFYFNETRQHIQWTVRVRPIRKDADGNPVDLKAIFAAIDTSVLDTLKQTIEAKDGPAFVAAYKKTLEACYSCHKASSLAFLRPMIPTSPLQPIINPDPDAKWPE